MEKEKQEFEAHARTTFTATIAKGKQCQHFGTIYEEESKRDPQCLLTRYASSQPPAKLLTPTEAKKLCPFHSTDIATRCIFYGNYPSSDNLSESIADEKERDETEFLLFIRKRLDRKMKIQNIEGELKKQMKVAQVHLGLERSLDDESVKDMLKRWNKNYQSQTE